MPDLFVAPEEQQVVAVPEPKPPTQSTLPTLHHVGMFATYGETPENISFGTQEPSERILLFLRRDFITNVPWVVSSILLAIAPTLFAFLTTLSNIQIVTIPGNFALVLLSLYYITVAAYIFVSFITWYYNVSLITNIRIMDVDFEQIIYKNVSETKLNLVQDVSYKQVGAIRTFYDYGDVLVQTAAAVDAFELYAVPRPQKVVAVIEELIGKEEETHVP